MIKGEMGRGRRAARPALQPPARPQTRSTAVSKAIIEMLQVDGRRSYASIAEELGISEDAVVQRVKQLDRRRGHADHRRHRPAPARLRAAGDARRHRRGRPASRWPRRWRRSRTSIYVVHHRRRLRHPRRGGRRERRPPARAGHRDQADPRGGRRSTPSSTSSWRSRPTRGASARAAGQLLRLLDLDLVVGVPLADDLLVELADAGARHLVDEGPGLGQLPLGEVLAEELDQLGRGQRGALAYDDRGQRPLAPLLVGDADRPPPRRCRRAPSARSRGRPRRSTRRRT